MLRGVVMRAALPPGARGCASALSQASFLRESNKAALARRCKKMELNGIKPTIREVNHVVKVLWKPWRNDFDLKEAKRVTAALASSRRLRRTGGLEGISSALVWFASKKDATVDTIFKIVGDLGLGPASFQYATSPALVKLTALQPVEEWDTIYEHLKTNTPLNTESCVHIMMEAAINASEYAKMAEYHSYLSNDSVKTLELLIRACSRQARVDPTQKGMFLDLAAKANEQAGGDRRCDEIFKKFKDWVELPAKSKKPQESGPDGKADPEAATTTPASA